MAFLSKMAAGILSLYASWQFSRYRRCAPLHDHKQAMDWLRLADLQDIQGYHLAHWAVLKSDIKLLHCLAEHKPLSCAHTTRQGLTALHLAVLSRLNHCVKVLVHTPALNIQDHKGRSPLMLACLQHQTQALQSLLQAHADLNLRDHQGQSTQDYFLTSSVLTETVHDYVQVQNQQHAYLQAFERDIPAFDKDRLPDLARFSHIILESLPNEEDTAHGTLLKEHAL